MDERRVNPLRGALAEASTVNSAPKKSPQKSMVSLRIPDREE
jgi:hypothetical protein